MVKSFILNRLGNKTNDIKYFKKYLPKNNVINIIEVFGGTFATIRNEYYDDKYNKIVNDNDTQLFYVYTNCDKYVDFSNRFNEDLKKYVNEKKILQDGYINIFEKYKNEDNKFFDLYTKSHIVRGKMCHIKKNNVQFDKIFNNIIFSCDDYKNIINKYKHDDKAFIFLDPPYLFSDNSQYEKTSKMFDDCDLDNTDIMIELYNLFNDKTVKCKIMLIINDLKILRWLFKDFIIDTYEKIYQLSKKKQKHLIICNYDINDL